MYYCIICEDNPDSLAKRKVTRPEHIARLEQLQNEGRLFVAGPNPAIDSPEPGENGFTGSLIIAEFPSLQDAKTWAQNDPYIKAGIYKDVIVKPFIKALP